MIELIGVIVDYLGENLLGIDVKPGFEPEFARQPALETAAYVSAKSIENGRLSFKINVYSPVEFSAEGCSGTAENIAQLMTRSACPVSVETIRIGEASFKEADDCFIVPVEGVVTEQDKMRYYFTAKNFALRSGMTISCQVPQYSVERAFEHDEIMTVFEELPLAVRRKRNKYSIVLHDVPTLFMDNFANSGTFELEVNNETYYDCFCISSVENTPRHEIVTVRGYAELEDEYPAGVYDPRAYN